MRILLITGHMFLAEGTIAKGIASSLKNHQVYFFSIHDFKYNLSHFRDLINHVEIVHWIFNLANLSEKYHFILDEIKSASVASVATVHHIDKDEIFKINAASKADMIHTVSTEWYYKVKIQTSTPVSLAYLGINKINPSYIKPLKFPSTQKLKIGLLGFFPGRNNRKRIDIALKVFEVLINRGYNLEVIIKGGGWEALLPMFLEKDIRIKQLKFGDSSDKSNFFKMIDFYLCTSDVEGGPYPVLESLNHGVPVISTKVGIAIDALKLGGGLLSKKADYMDLADNIIYLFESKTDYQIKSIEALEIAKKFKWSNLKESYESMYEKTLDQFVIDSKYSIKTDNHFKLKPKKQREIAIQTSSIYEIPNYLYTSQYSKAVMIYIKLIFSQHIKIKRKISALTPFINLIRFQIKKIFL